MSTQDLGELFGGSAKGGLADLLPQVGARPSSPSPSSPGEEKPHEPPEKPDSVEDAAPVEEAEGSASSSPTPRVHRSPGEREASGPASAKREATTGRSGSAAASRSRRAPKPRANAASPDVEETTTAQISVYLLPEAKEAVARIREEQGKLNAEIAFDAIDAVSPRLQDLVRARQRSPRPQGSLFPARSTRRRPRVRRPGDQRRVLWTIQATPQEMMVLEELVKVTGAGSVSLLISVAIEAYVSV